MAIVNDSVLEDVETFSILLSSADPNVNIGTQSVIISITDNDGINFYFITAEYNYYYCLFLTLRGVFKLSAAYVYNKRI